MSLYSKIRKFILGPDLSSGYISARVRMQAKKCLQAHAVSTDKVLDVGCGEGKFLLEASKSQASLEFFAIDAWDEIVQYIKQQLIINDLKNVNIKVGEAVQLPFADKQFQHVFFINTLHNQKDKKEGEEIIKELLRVAGSKSRIYIDIRNKRNMFFFLMYKILLFFDNTNPKVNMYSKKELIEFLSQFNLKKIHFISVDIFKSAYVVELLK